MTLIFILVVPDVFGACRSTFRPPYFTCDTMYEARKVMLFRQQYEYSEKKKVEDEDTQNPPEPVVITIEKLYRVSGEIEVIIDPYEGLGEFDEPEVFEIDMKVLENLTIE